MKTLIIYGTKHGSAKKCSEILKKKINGDVTVVNAAKDNIPDLSMFDTIIVGGSIYMGNIQKEVKSFCFNNSNVLKNKRVGLFICCMNKENTDDQINNAFPKEILDNAVCKESFGGEFIFKTMNFMERFIVKKISKTDKDISEINDKNIDEFVRKINNI